MERETLVLLPGMMCDERLFAPQLKVFGKSHHCIVPRLEAASISAMAEQVLAAVDAPEFSLAGLSMGGIVAMEMIAMAPQRITHLALLDTNHRADAPERRAIRDRQIVDVRDGRLRDVILDEMKPAYLAKRNRSNQALLDLLIDMAMDIGEDAFVAQSLALRDRSDQSVALKSYTGPALVMCGAEDSLCPPDRHREIAALLHDAELLIVPDAGHMTTLENAEAVNTALAHLLVRSVD